MAKRASTAPASLFKKLSSVFLVSSSVFAKATPTQQTEALSSAGGLPVVFVSDFSELSNKTKITSKLLRGEDCSLELEFNEVVLTDEDKRCLELIKPILAKVNEIGPKYPWQEELEPTTPIECGHDYVTRAGHKMRKSLAERVWAKASRYWAGVASRAPSEMYESIAFNSGHNYIRFEKGQVRVGCQNIPRNEVEYIARQYGWEPSLV